MLLSSKQSGAHLWLCSCFYLALSVSAVAVKTGDSSFIFPQKHIDTSEVKGYTAEAEADRVTTLPGWDDLDIGLYAGYVTVDELAGRALYYAFVEAKENASAAPVLLWLNGGPGCSSIGGGFMSELGPFYPDGATGKLVANPHSWHHFANVLFLDSPAFVGFSYSNTTSDKYVGDARTAKDAHAFLRGFFQRFPQYQSNDFWITGESYAGHYVPNLAWEILKPAPSEAAKKSRKGLREDEVKINLVGIMVGNAWTDTATDNEGAVDYWWSHALISDESARGIKKNCDFSKIGPLQAPANATPLHPEYVSVAGPIPRPTRATTPDNPNPFDDCDTFVYQGMWEMGNINIYDIFADVCLSDDADAARRRQPKRRMAAARQLAKLLRGAPAANSLALRAVLGPNEGEDPVYDPCVDNEVEAYLNRPEVLEALNVAKLSWNWTDCSPYVNYSYRDLLSSVLHVYHRLLSTGTLKILVYSGDVDAIVPVVGTRRWVSRLGRPVVKPWKPWISGTKQVGGYVVEYDGITLATVRGAGHMVPYVQPERASTLIKGYLTGSL